MDGTVCRIRRAENREEKGVTALRQERKQRFGSDCVIWSMRRHYPAYTGREKWLVVSDLCEEELEQRYPELATVYAPYIRITREQACAILRSEREEKRSGKRRVRHDPWTDDGASAGARRLRKEAVQQAHRRQREKEEAEDLREAVAQLPPVMKKRIEMYYFEGYGMQEIADMEGVHPVTVYKAVTRAQEKLRGILEEMRTDPQQRQFLRDRIQKEVDRVIPIRAMHRGVRSEREQAVRLNLCTVCRRMILEEGTCRLRRMDPYDRPKERCDVCGTRAGCMHLVTRHAYNNMQNREKAGK